VSRRLVPITDRLRAALLDLRAKPSVAAFRPGETADNTLVFGVVDNVKKGAFTGATGYKKGMFESAGFLDEFGEMSSSMQVRLLRVLQEHKVRPVGSETRKRSISMHEFFP
jgi:transcriptional regulator of aromatic amino acid metabolism